MGSTTRTGRAGTDIHITTDMATDRRERRSRGQRAAAFATLAALGIAACGSGNDSAISASEASTEDQTFSAPAATDSAAAESELTIVGDIAAPNQSAAPATGGVEQAGAPIDFGRDLIVEAAVTMQTGNVRDAVDDIIRLSNDNGGAVFNADVTIDDPLDDGSVPGYGTIVIRIPPAQLDQLISDLRGVGTLRNQSQSVDDVTDQLIDLDIQIRQAFESVERMEAILVETTDFNALVAAETELVRRQTAYERLLAAQRNIDDRVALSTLTVQVEYRSPAVDEASVADSGDPGLGDAFSDGWNAFVGVLFGISFVLAVTAPFVAVALVIALLGWIMTRRLRRHQTIDRNRNEPMDGPLPTPARSATVTSATDSAELADSIPNE